MTAFEFRPLEGLFYSKLEWGPPLQPQLMSTSVNQDHLN